MTWFTPKCPVDDKDKVWLEQAGAWLIKEFQIRICEVTVVLPTPEFFPDSYHAEEDDVQILLNRVCSFMGVSADRLTLELFTEEPGELRNHLPFFESWRTGAGGHYHQREEAITIGISTSYLRDPMTLVAVIAHELGHVLLLADKEVFRERKDHEYLSDLLTVLLGLGIFTANSAFHFRQWSGGGKQGWKAKRLGYLTGAKFGYALALFAHARGESKPDWSEYLEGDVKYHFKSGLRYLESQQRKPIAY